MRILRAARERSIFAGRNEGPKLLGDRLPARTLGRIAWTRKAAVGQFARAETDEAHKAGLFVRCRPTVVALDLPSEPKGREVVSRPVDPGAREVALTDEPKAAGRAVGHGLRFRRFVDFGRESGRSSCCCIKGKAGAICSG